MSLNKSKIYHLCTVSTIFTSWILLW